jgi:ABC-type transport system substrate-binding protein
VACGGDDDDDAAPTSTTVAAAAPTSTTAAPVSKFNGNLKLGEILIDPPVFLPSKQGTGNSQLLGFWGFFETMLYAKASAPPDLNVDESTFNLGLAESWIVASDTSTVTFNIRKGV